MTDSEKLKALTDKMERKLEEIQNDPLYKAKPASVSINAPKALMQAGLYSQYDLLRLLLGCNCQDPANGFKSQDCPIHS